MAAPFDYELRRQLSKQSDQLSGVLDTLISHNVDGAREAKAQLCVTPKSLREKAVAVLDNLWDNFQLPLCKLEEYHGLIQHWRRDQQTRAEVKELARVRAQYEDDTNKDLNRVITIAASDANPSGASFLMAPSVSDSAVPPAIAADAGIFEITKFVIYKDRVTKALNPATQELFSRPLEYIHNVNLNDFADAIVKFALTDIIDVSTSLQNIIERCEIFGFSKGQVSRLLRAFIAAQFPQFSFVIENSKTPRDVWTQILALVRIEDVATSAAQKLASFVRHPGTNIETAFLKYKTLLRLKIKHSEPHASVDTVERKSDSQARLALPELVSDTLKSHLISWLSDRKRDGDNIKTADIIDYLHALEMSDEKFRLAHDRCPANRITSETVEMFATDVTANMTRSAVAANNIPLTPFKDHPEKNNKPGTPSQTPASPFSRGGGRGGRRPRGGGRGGRGGRKPPAHAGHQPADAARRPGRSQSRPRGRGNRGHRSASRGPPRGAQATQDRPVKEICMKCFNLHAPPCKIYLKQAPTKCPLCQQGYHWKSACRMAAPKNV